MRWSGGGIGNGVIVVGWSGGKSRISLNCSQAACDNTMTSALTDINSPYYWERIEPEQGWGALSGYRAQIPEFSCQNA